MTFILISGITDVGKTHVCKRLYDILYQDPSFAKLGGWNINRKDFVDFIAHYRKGEKYIVLNSPSDNDYCMKRLAGYLDDFRATYGKYPDIIVTTIRETDSQKDQKSRMLALLYEVAQGKKNLAAHYTSVIMQRPIHTPFALESLGSHAFVLHLERQPVSGTKEEREKALAPYWNGIVNKAKKTLDLAVARL